MVACSETDLKFEKMEQFHIFYNVERANTYLCSAVHTFLQEGPLGNISKK
jgi:hypothetical protein